MSSRPLLLDTCAAIWLANGDPMSEQALQALDVALQDGARVDVSPITAWEIGLLCARGRLSLTSRPEVWFQSLIRLPGLSLARMEPDLLIASSYLPGSPPADPADRIIAATSREGGYRLMTRDSLLIRYAEAGHLDLIAC